MFEAAGEAALLLGIDTSGVEGSLALARVHADQDAELLAQVSITGRHSSAELIPRLKELFAAAGAVVADLRAIVVVNGPGSFTGLRIGISAAKALAEAAALPLVAVSRLAMLSGLAENDTASVLDAGRGEYYLRLPAAADMPAIESLESLPALIEKTGGAKICICEPQLAESLAALDIVLVPPPTAFDAIRLAQPLYFADRFDDAAALDANYVRRSYAGQPAANASGT